MARPRGKNQAAADDGEGKGKGAKLSERPNFGVKRHWFFDLRHLEDKIHLKNPKSKGKIMVTRDTPALRQQEAGGGAERWSRVPAERGTRWILVGWVLPPRHGVSVS